MSIQYVVVLVFFLKYHLELFFVKLCFYQSSRLSLDLLSRAGHIESTPHGLCFLLGNMLTIPNFLYIFKKD